MESPFVANRELVLGQSAPACFLRQLVLSMAGDGAGISLCAVRALDDEHAAAVVAMLQAYRANPHGHAFHALAEACRRRGAAGASRMSSPPARKAAVRAVSLSADSPFVVHRDKVMGHYWAASFMRRVVLSLAGEGVPVDLSLALSLDREHGGALVDMLQAYHADPEGGAFRELVDACLARRAEETAASERAERFEVWLRATSSYVAKLGLDAGLTEDRHGWFEHRFDAGDTPELAAYLALDVDLQASLAD